jgi:hypothetical protein
VELRKEHSSTAISNYIKELNHRMEPEEGLTAAWDPNDYIPI